MHTHSLRLPLRVFLAQLALLIVTAGCGHARSSRVSDSTFVLTMADLQRIQAAPSLDSATRAAQRRAVLQRRGLRADQLEDAGRVIAQDATRAAAIWSSIENHVQRGDSGGRRQIAPQADSAHRADSLAAAARDTTAD